jgi:hypothetical protein
MTFGDPFAKFYRDDDDDETERNDLIERGIIPGALVKISLIETGLTSVLVHERSITLWKNIESLIEGFSILPSQVASTIIICIDTKTDPVRSWACLLVTMINGTTKIGWVSTKNLWKIKET